MKGKNQRKGVKTMNQHIANSSEPLGQKPLVVTPDILSLYKRAENDDLDAIFDLSRHFFSFEGNTNHLQAALYYKSLVVNNFPSDYDLYSCAVTMTDIAHIFGLLDNLEESKGWFVKTYRYVFNNYHAEERRNVLEEIGYFISLDAFGFNLREVIVTE
ncbi:MAG: hypothetical protein F6K19_26570 [Cyanothece sp. SIO1E1]|nr:hypothetical protein [Cyanothece sp. SIO1E1]